MPTNNQRLKQPGRASLRGQLKVATKSGNPWPWVTEVAQILGLAKVNSSAPLCAKRESEARRGVFAEVNAGLAMTKRKENSGEQQ